MNTIKSLVVHGNKNKKTEINASDIVLALKSGGNVDIENVVINGEIKLSKEDFVFNRNSVVVIPGGFSAIDCVFNDNVDFSLKQFGGIRRNKEYEQQLKLFGNVSLKGSVFLKKLIFIGVEFFGKVNLSHAIFRETNIESINADGRDQIDLCEGYYRLLHDDPYSEEFIERHGVAKGSEDHNLLVEVYQYVNRYTVHFTYCVFKNSFQCYEAEIFGNFSFRHSRFLSPNAEIAFFRSIFRGVADFRGMTIGQKGQKFCRAGEYFSFAGCEFQKNALFNDSLFYLNMSFRGSVFKEGPNFSRCLIAERVVFTDVRMGGKIDFSDISYVKASYLASVCSDTVVIWDMLKDFIARILRNKNPPSLSGCKECQNDCFMTDNCVKTGDGWRLSCFKDLDIDLVDKSKNMVFYDYLRYEQWLTKKRQESKLSFLSFYLWNILSFSGRSFIVWMGWLVVVVFMFALAYNNIQGMPEAINTTPVTSGLLRFDNEFIANSFFVNLCISLMIFISPSYTGITPLSTSGLVCVLLEGLIGYVMLGVLISLIISKMRK